MKKNIFYTLAALLTLCACSQNEEQITPGGNGQGENTSSLVEARTQSFEASKQNDDEFEEAASQFNAPGATRSSLTFNTTTSELEFKWSQGDWLSVYPNLQTPNTPMLNYKLSNGQDTRIAQFTAEGLEMADTVDYFAFTPGISMDLGTKEKIILDYSGQKQVDNGSTAHMGKYNFMASHESPKDNKVNFQFKNISSAMRIRIQVPQAGTYTKFELLRADEEAIPYLRKLNLSAGGEAGDAYAPLSEPADEDKAGHDVKGQNGFELELNHHEPDGREAPGIIISDPSELLVMYMMFPATKELEGLPLLGRLTDENGKIFYITMNGFELKPTTYVKYGKKATPADRLNINLKVNKLWHVGNTQTRAGVGDPGYDKDDLKAPRYVYFYVCKKDKFYYMHPFDGVPESDWTDNGDEWVYNKTLEVYLSPGELLTDETIHVYAVASYSEIFTAGLPLGEISEATIANLEYGLPEGSGDLNTLFGTTTPSDAQKQTYFKNVYTNDYKLGKDDPTAMSMTLYHNFAKLDVQWNNLTGTALSGNVTLNNKNRASGIKLFKPTTNTFHNDPDDERYYFPSVPITGGTCWNGRAVFYVPQVESRTYTIELGDNPANTQTVTFDAPTNVTLGETSDYGKAAWLKANITLNP